MSRPTEMITQIDDRTCIVARLRSLGDDRPGTQIEIEFNLMQIRELNRKLRLSAWWIPSLPRLSRYSAQLKQLLYGSLAAAGVCVGITLLWLLVHSIALSFARSPVM